MAIRDEEHPLLQRAKDISFMVPYWDKVDAIVEGYDAIKMAGKDYLPMFSGEDQADYDVRLKLTKFTNIYRDVLEGLSSKPFEEEITLIGNNIPEEIEKFVEDVDGSGNNISVFSALTFFNGINAAIDWIFIDHPVVDPNVVRSKADAAKANIRPFWTHVLGRNILEVRSVFEGSKEHLTYVRVFEPATNDTPDRVRVFERINGVVTWELYEKNEKGRTLDEKMVKIESGVLSINLIPFVPFITGRRDGKTFKIYPPMRDAADLQITLYQDESGLQFIKNVAAYPMLAANGMEPEKDEKGNPVRLRVGPMKVLYGKPNGNGGHGQWSYVEPSAHSMTFLQTNIDKTKQDLRELGRQPLTALSSQLTTVTTAIAAGKAKSAVSAWALSLKDALENALVITALWMSVTYDPEVNVFTEFDNVSDTNADIDNLLTARDKGDLSQETLWSEMKRRKVLSPEFDADDERDRILQEIPSQIEINDLLDIPENQPVNAD